MRVFFLGGGKCNLFSLGWHCLSAVRLQLGSIQTSCCTVMQDAMDQAKFRMPRLRMRRSKLSERLYRPTQHILASWVHGFGLTFFVSQECMPKNSETSVEATSRVLNDVYRESSCKLPLTLHVQHDGTPREAKNQYYCRYLISLVVLRVFRQTCISFLRPGHSHEDLDQVFSQVGSMLSHSEFATPDQLLELLNGTCRPDAAQGARQKRAKLSKIAASASMLDQTAGWKAWSSVVGVTLRGLRHLICFR